MSEQFSLFTAGLGSMNSSACGVSPLIFDFGNEEEPAEITITKPAPDPHVINLKYGPKTHAEVISAWEKLPHEIQYGKLRLVFSNPVSLTMNRRKRSEPSTTHEKRLFIGKSTKCLCYTSTTRTGFFLEDADLYRLIRIEPVVKENVTEKVRKLANRIHPNAWCDLKEKLLTNPAEYASNYGYTVTSITGKFPKYVLDEIKQAFENKTEYRYRKDSPVFAPTHTWGGTSNRAGRDLKVECKLCDDGIFRAWYSSEYPGCLNGDYWLLLNPTTAAFKERD